MKKSNIIHGDCIEEIKKLEDNSVDAIITDPPYGLGFMGKEWDTMDSSQFGIAGEEGENDLKVKKNFKILPRIAEGGALQKFSYEWAKECLRVLKPGGYLLAFGGTRTYHRMTCGIEDAGFEIRDCIMWLYGSGFPKSLNIGKKIDQIQGNEREVIGISPNEKDFRDVGKKVKEEIGIDKLSFGTIQNAERKDLEITKGNSEWEGWGTALKPACEPIVLARKPLSEKSVCLNVLKHGTGGINIDECRIGTDLIKSNGGRKDSLTGVTKNYDYGFNAPHDPLNTEHEGRFPANVILECTCDKLLEGKAGGSPGHWSKSKVTGFGEFGNGKSEYEGVGDKDDMKCFVHTDPNCPCYILDEQSGKTGALAPVKSGQKEFGGVIYGKFKSGGDDGRTFHDNGKLGGASRFFYCAKASKSERNFGLENTDLPEKPIPINEPHNSKNLDERYSMTSKNNHPTVKPLKLIEYLIKLVTKPGAVVLDPFLGSGTTLIACAKMGRIGIGIEKEEDYIKIAEARIKPFLEQSTL